MAYPIKLPNRTRKQIVLQHGLEDSALKWPHHGTLGPAERAVNSREELEYLRPPRAERVIRNAASRITAPRAGTGLEME